MIYVGVFCFFCLIGVFGYWIYGRPFQSFNSYEKKTRKHHYFFIESTGTFLDVDFLIQHIHQKCVARQVVHQGALIQVEAPVSLNRPMALRVGVTVMAADVESLQMNCPELSYTVLPETQMTVFEMQTLTRWAVRRACKKFDYILQSRDHHSSPFFVIFLKHKLLFMIPNYSQ